MKKSKLIKSSKRKAISICRRYSIFEVGNIETKNSIKYIRKIIDWVCFKAYTFDRTQPLSVQQICGLLIKYYHCSNINTVYRKGYQIDLFLSETCVITEQKLKYYDRAFYKNGLYQDINNFIDTNKANHYCYINNK